MSTASLEDTNTVKHLIGDDWVDGGDDEYEVLNPADGRSVVSRLASASEAQLRDAVQAAGESAQAWAATSPIVRATVLLRAADLFEERVEEISTVLTLEEGKTIGESRGEVLRAARIFRFYAGEAERPFGEVYASSRDYEYVTTHRVPVGVVAVITPWNFPVLIPAWKLAPAILFGNAVVWKPASTTPRVSALFARVLTDAGLPPGVLNLVVASGSTAEALITARGVNAVTFTGSTSVGKHLIGLAGESSKKIQAEMGGMNAVIVMPDANLEKVADEVTVAAMSGTGQKCTAASRLLVHESVHDRLLSEISLRLKEWTAGDGLDPKSDMGPLVSHAALDDVTAAVEGAIERGEAEMVAGGASHSAAQMAEGFFVPPYLLHCPSPETDAWNEEVFGPVLFERTFRELPEAVELANHGAYGLVASVYTEQSPVVETCLELLNVGQLHVNSQTAYTEPHVPFGGSKDSGFGPKEQGRSAREFFTETVTVYRRSKIT